MVFNHDTIHKLRLFSDLELETTNTFKTGLAAFSKCVSLPVVWWCDWLPSLQLPLDQIGDIGDNDTGGDQTRQPDVRDGLGHDASNLLLQV